MKVAVTGGSGQLGTLVLRRLAEDPHVSDIVSIDLRPPCVASTKIRSVIADVRDLKVARHIEGCDALIHLAFVVTTAPARRVFDAINVSGSRNVFNAAARAGIPRIIYSSSIAAYGVVPGHPVPITEETPRRHEPAFAYSATKYEVEAFLDSFERKHPEIAIARLRPSILLGRQMDHSLGHALLRGIVPVLSDTPLPIVWDEDVADAVMLALRNNAHGAFNLSADNLLPPVELARAAGMRGVRVPPLLLKAVSKLTLPFARLGLGRGMDPAWLDHLNVPMIVSSEKAKRELGWRPRFPRAVDVVRHLRKVTDHESDLRLMAFFQLLDLVSRRVEFADPRHEQSAPVHLVLTGAKGGDYAIRVNGGHLSISRGAPRPPAAEVTMEADTFLELLAGRVDFASAVASDDIRIEGDKFAAMAVREIVAHFRKQATQTGVTSWPVRRMAQWFAEATTH